MRRAAVAGAVGALALLVVGCATTKKGGGPVTAYSVYTLLPLQGAGAERSRDVVDGAKLALREAGGRAGDLTLNLRSVDTSAGGAATPHSVAVATDVAVTDPGAVAAIGALDSEDALVEVPLLNAASTALVSPGATYTGLTSSRAAQPGEPERLYPNRARTFLRLVGSDLTQAPALVALAHDAGCRELATVAGADAVQRSLVALVRAAARAHGVRLGPLLGHRPRVSRAPDCAFVAVSQPGAGARLLDALHAALPRTTLLAPATVCVPGLVRALAPATVARTRVLCPLGPVRQLAPAAAAVAARFASAFGRPPGPYGLLGFDAMRAILRAVGEAGSRAHDQAVVAAALLAPGPRPSVAGPTATLVGGETAPARWSEAMTRAGRLVVLRTVGR